MSPSVLIESHPYLVQWENGRDLSHLTTSPGWSILVAMLEQYDNEAVTALVSIDPAEEEDVLAQHATAFSTHRLRVKLLEDIASCVREHHATSLQDLLRKISEENQIQQISFPEFSPNPSEY